MPGTIEKRGKNSWRLTVPAGLDANGQQIRYRKTVTAASRVAAEKALAEFITEVEHGQAASTGAGRMTLRDFFIFWLDHNDFESNTVLYYQNLWRRINPAMGHLRLQKLEPRHILAFMKNLSEPGIKADGGVLNQNTQRKYFVILKTLFNAAKKWRFVAYNPCDNVTPPKPVHNPRPILDTEQTAHFMQCLASAPLKWQAAVLLALAGGLRREELCGLEWRDIGPDHVTVREARTYAGKKYGVVEKAPKTTSSARKVTIPENVMAVVRQHKAEQYSNRLKLGPASTGGKWEGPEAPENEKVFTQWNGKPIHPTSFTAWLREFSTAHGLPCISPHTLRHMTATYLITSGIDVRTVAGKLGHADGRVTMQVYSHLLKSAEKESAEVMGNFIAAAQQKAPLQNKKTAPK